MAQSLPMRRCDACPSLYQPLRVTSQFCSGRCRKRAQRARLKDVVAPTKTSGGATSPPPSTLGPIASALLAELREQNKDTSSLGAQALDLAARIDDAKAESGSALAALNRELRACRAELQAQQAPVEDALEVMRRKRAERLAGARG